MGCSRPKPAGACAPAAGGWYSAPGGAVECSAQADSVTGAAVDAAAAAEEADVAIKCEVGRQGCDAS